MAYKQANHRKVDGRKILVDFERGTPLFYYILGRTTLKWKPRRFGGGSGDRRLTKE